MGVAALSTVAPVVGRCFEVSWRSGLEGWKGEDHHEHRATPHGTGAGRRRGEMHRADGDRRVGQIIKARREAATHRVGVGPNGRELGGADPRYVHLQASHN
jgi:hypothetical protein